MLARRRAGQHDVRRYPTDDVGSFMTQGIPCLLLLAQFLSAGNEEKRKIFGGWVKITVTFLAVSEPKFTKFWDDVG